MAPIELVLGAPAAGGGFVARGPDGRVVFVRHGLPGERVLAEIVEEHATWARADVVEVLEASQDRVAAPCPYAGAGRCGGCDYQHVALPAQRALKAERLADQLRAIAGLDVAVDVAAVGGAVGGAAGLGTRTRVRFAVDARGRLAMRQHHRHDLVPVEACALGVEAIQALRLAARSFPPGAEVEAAALDGAPEATVAVRTPPPKGARGSGHRTRLLDGPGLAAVQATSVGGARFTVSPGVFWQVHANGPQRLCEEVLEGLSLSAGDRVVDLYCGAGLFSAVTAQAVGPTGWVLGVDASVAATEDARRNLADLPWARVVTARVDGRIVRDEAEGCTHAVLDPPRRGADRGALDTLGSLASLRRVVSVSCDPSTFARDLRVLLDGGWRLAAVRALDLFEMTEHVECVAVLER
ncbi:MAG TPA: methyltransferase [Acidimicrobiales bacterium]|nr:methyltransferase [Acidimicrobiales bacterium]